MIKKIKYLRYYYYIVKAKFLKIFFKKRYVLIFSKYRACFEDKKGLEIGGPTKLFSSDILPIYKVAKIVDGCNFNEKTIWENDKNRSVGNDNRKKGIQYICEGSHLHDITDESYDFLLSSHNLEHMANAIKTIKEWLRVLKPGGVILLIVPDKRYIFDRKREFTTFGHFKEDYINKVDETDLTHLSEILEKHDLDFDPDVQGDFASFEKRCRNNLENRCMHHHVFNQDVLNELFTYLNIQIICQYNIPLFHQIIVGKKQ